MQTCVQNSQNYFGYTKCGEILKSPSQSFQPPYVLKCFQCDEIYLLLESFIIHIEDSCKDVENQLCSTELESVNDKSVENKNARLEETVGAGVETVENVTVKIEDNNPMETEDPFIGIKPECLYDDDDLSSVKEEEEPNLPKDHMNVTDGNKQFEIKDKTDLNDDGDDNTNEDEINDALYEAASSSSEEIELEDSELSDSENEGIKKPAKRKSSERSYIFVNNFMKSKTNISALIVAYKNRPSLWNKNIPSIRHKIKRQILLEDIAKELKDQQSLDITWKQVASVVVYLCRKYREDLKGLKESEEKNNKYKPEWYFDELAFMKPFMENNLIAKLDSHMPDLLPDQIIQLLEIYKKYTHLWNSHQIEFYCKNKRNDAKKGMLQSVETNMNIKISQDILDDYLRTVHNCFSKAKINRLNIKNTSNKKDDTKLEENKQDYYEHMLFLYDHVGIFKCSVCDREFKNPLNLKIHKSQHDGCEPLTCSLCNKEFKTATSYTNHAKRHMEDLNHECSECGKKFLHSTDLRIHMRKHTSVKPFCCEICGASFRHIQGFTNHRRRHDKNYLHTCHICAKGYYSKDRYNDHMNAHQNIRQNICNVCGKAFITKRSLQQHSVIHEDIRRHACKLCGKTFKHKTGVNQHMKTHGIANSEEKSTVNNE